MIDTSKTLISKLMDKYSLPSMYAVAKLMDKSPQTVANWVKKDTTLDDESARVLAELLEIDYEYVLICMKAERASGNPSVARAWTHVAEAWNKAKPAMISASMALFSIAILPFQSGLI